jgi:hypothetical protein
MPLTPDHQQEILALLDRYAQCYTKKSLEGILSLSSPGISGFGSGPDEIVPDFTRFREQIRRDLAQADAVSVSFDVLKLDGQMPFAWISAFSTFDVRIKEERITLHGRMTALFRNTGSRWLFEQVHFSLPYEGQQRGASYPGSS